MKEKLHGRLCEQTEGSLAIVCTLLEKARFKHILELGSGEGGFTAELAFFIQKQSLDCSIVSLDEDDRNNTKTFLDELAEQDFPVQFRQETFVDQPERLEKYFVRSGPVLVLCDTIKKWNELDIVANWLESGDYLMSHDWGNDPVSGGITEEQAKEIEARGFERIEPALWAEYYWICFRKI